MTIAANISHRPVLPLLLALSGAHLLNDLIASMIPAMYPLLKDAYQLDFAQIGLITLAFHVTSSLLQPVLGYLTDHKPWAYAMVAGMASTLIGVVGLASANNYAVVLVSGVVGLTEIAGRVGTPYFMSKPFDLDDLILLLERSAAEKRPPVPTIA